MDSLFVLHLIRHAPTVGNQAKQYIGWTDEPVAPFEALAFPEVKNVWGSDLQRCRQTAEVLFPAAFYHPDANWRECHFGKWEQKTYAELESMEAYRNWINDPFRYKPPGGESLNQVAERVERAVCALPHEEEFMIVTHGGPIRYLLARAKQESFWKQTVLHGHLYTIVWQNRQAFEEGTRCTSFSEVPLMANAST
ncbi:histidine phosphatase family protein [Planomicrobium sp. CPCC 101079]|uniref:histidine phosphatase family protein n=1 Tax=Planomicrobium sp. CPCC 101079 TaxID=2599618 RepID=UPI0011B7D7FE|nr:histidine phosphatase family protein [Planomicrobium sp. CPCC 101079]TWT03495.1 histidine phosphatase family protein [Planomicrobium sp. CPCC 101079]